MNRTDTFARSAGPTGSLPDTLRFNSQSLTTPESIRALLKGITTVGLAGHGFSRFTTELLMSEQDQEADKTVEEVLGDEMVRMMETLGPHTTEGVVTEMRATDMGSIVVAGDRYPLPRKLIQRVLSYRDEFVQDGSGRWHLRG